MRAGNMRRAVILLLMAMLTLLALMLVTSKADAATISKSDYKHLKGLWRTEGGGEFGHYHVRFTRSKVKYYYKWKKGQKLKYDHSVKIRGVKTDWQGNKWYKVGRKNNTFYYVWKKKHPFKLQNTWYEGGEEYYSGTDSLKRVFKKLKAPKKIGLLAKYTGKDEDGLRYGKVYYSWSKVKGASGYQIKTKGHGEDRHWSSWRTLNASKNRKFMAPIGPFGGSTIKMKVRAYKVKSGKRIYGKWSKVRLFHEFKLSRKIVMDGKKKASQYKSGR